MLKATWECGLGDRHRARPSSLNFQPPLIQESLGPHLVSDSLCCATHLASGTHTAPATTGHGSQHLITAPSWPALNSCRKLAYRGLARVGGQSSQCLCSWHCNMWPAERAAWPGPGPRPSRHLPAPNTKVPQPPWLAK